MLPDSFLSGFEWTAKSPYCFNDFGPLWASWYQDTATPAQKKEILDAVKSKTFTHDLRQWMLERFPGYPSLTDLIIYQLSSEEPFSRLSSWTTVSSELVTDVFGVAVPGDVKGSREHIWRMRAWLIPTRGNEKVKREAFNFTLSDREAKSAPHRTIRALHATLNQLCGWPFLKSFLKADWRQKIFEQRTVWVASALSLLLLILYAVAPDWYFRNNTPLLLWTSLFVTVSLVLAGRILITIVRNWKSASGDALRWVDLLEKSSILITIHGEDEITPKPFTQGASYSITLAISLLLALDQSARASSAFFRQIISQLRARKGWLYTGGLNETGNIEPATYLINKLEAALDHQEISTFVYSSKGPAVDGKSSSLEPSPLDSSKPARSFELKRRAENNCVDAVVVHAGTPPRMPQQLRFHSLSALLFDVPRFSQCAAGSLLFVWSFAVLTLAISASLDAYRLCFPAATPKMSMVMQAHAFNSHAKVSLTVCTKEANQFAVKLTSDYWQSLHLIWFHHGSSSHSSTTMPLNLTKSPQTPPEFDIYDGRIELMRRRSLLWRQLPPVERLSVTTIIDLFVTQKVQCAEEEL
jgi:hypothetical protein